VFNPLILILFFTAIALFYNSARLGALTGLMDTPGGRKTHQGAVPIIGGIVAVPLFLIGLIAAGLWDKYWVLIMAATIMTLMGVVDDRFHLNPYFKFAVQVFVSCFVVVFGHIEVELLGNLFGFGEVNLMHLAKPFSVMCLVMFMNAMNMIDGLDGLHGGMAAIMIILLMLAALLAGAIGQVMVLALLLSPLVAFLIYNMRYPGHTKASVFMGDAGTLTMGLILGWFTIQFSQSPLNIISPAVAPWIVGLVIADTLALYMYRTLNKQKPFEPDRNHIHHLFVDNGVGVGKTTALLLAFVGMSAGAALIFEQAGLPPFVIFYLWLIFFFTHMYFKFHPQKVIALAGRFA
jgi:UDP-GlcNAc:undecaprenyl-phosphate GlcNAc-1-phosphate transferase